MINTFRGKYYFLSNFSPCIILYGDFSYPSLEHAYQSTKTENRDEKLQILLCKTPGKAKQFGKNVKLKNNWEKIKFQIMEELLTQKFSKEPFKTWLLETENEELIEGNFWHDNVWGICYCNKCKGKGNNQLGKILMKIRKDLLTNTLK